MGLLYDGYNMSGLHMQWKTEKVAADTHLAWLGVKIARNGILGITFHLRWNIPEILQKNQKTQQKKKQDTDIEKV